MPAGRRTRWPASRPLRWDRGARSSSDLLGVGTRTRHITPQKRAVRNCLRSRPSQGSGLVWRGAESHTLLGQNTDSRLALVRGSRSGTPNGVDLVRVLQDLLRTWLRGACLEEIGRLLNLICDDDALKERTPGALR